MAVHLHLKKEVASQVGIANAAGLTEVTLRNRLKDLKLRRDVFSSISEHDYDLQYSN
jgi:transcription initiation factor TFIIIB Brf1 subunit/transcription initiation factor TFIIB